MIHHRKEMWTDGAPFEDWLIGDDAPPVAKRNICYGGGKSGSTGTQQQNSTVSIPPEVLARYNSVNAQADQTAQNPFQSYGGEFVAPVNQWQGNAIQNITAARDTLQPYYNQAGSQFGLAGGNIAQAQQQGSALGAAAGQSYTGAYAGAQPYQQQATALAGAGSQAVDPNSLNIGAYMSPYNQAVVQSTLALTNQQQQQQQAALRSQQIMNGSFGGDRSGISQDVLSGQQNLASANIASGLYNQNYQQALGAAQQQQGVALGAAQANRAATQWGAGELAALGQQGYAQGMGLGQAQQSLGQQQYSQGLGAAQAQQQLGQGYAGLGSSLLQGQLAQGQAQLGAGTVMQQTQQAQDQALYNQFLQQQAYPFQTTQFLANIAEGTGALSGSSTQATSWQPQPFWSDERLKENIRKIGETKDGLKIIRFNYKGHPQVHVGFSAQDVEKKKPEAVGLAGGYKTVDYDRATRARGGLANGGHPYYRTTGTYRPDQYDELLRRQRATEGYRAAMRDPQTGKIYSAHSHQAAIDKVPKDDTTGAWGRLSGEWDKGTNNTGFLNAKGDFVSRDDAERDHGISTMEDLRDLRRGKLYRSRGGLAGGGPAPMLYEFGGSVANDNAGQGYADGGSPYYDSATMAAILAAQQAMYPGGGGRNLEGGPRGVQLQQSGNRSLMKAELPKAQKEEEPGLKQGIHAANDLAGAGKSAADLYRGGKDAIVGSAGNGSIPETGGMIGRGGKLDWDKGWIGRQTSGLGAAASSAPADLVSAAPADTSLISDAVSRAWDYRRGGRARRYASGGTPYDDGSGYVPDDDDTSDPAKLLAEQKGLASASALPAPPRGGSGGGDNTLGDVASILGTAAKIIPMFLRSGGRAGFEEGGAPDDDTAIRLADPAWSTEPDAIHPRRPTGVNPERAGAVERSERTPSTSERFAHAGDNVVPFPTAGLDPHPGTSPTSLDLPARPPAAAPVTVQATPPDTDAAARAQGLAGSDARNRVIARPEAQGAPSEHVSQTVDDARRDAARQEIAKTAAAIPTPASPGLVPTVPAELKQVPGAGVMSTPTSKPGLVQTPSPTAEPGAPTNNFPASHHDRIIRRESGGQQFDAKGGPLTGGAGEIGAGQILPATGPEAARLAGLPWNEELFRRPRTGDPVKDKETTDYNLALSRAYYGAQVKAFGDPNVAAAAYNAGPENVRKAMAEAQRTGQSYLNFLPKSTQEYVRDISGGGGNAAALNGPPPARGLGDANMPTTANAPANPYEGKDFLDRAGIWVDRHERQILPALSFLGNMLSSPSRTLAGSIGSGMIGAANAWKGQQEVGQGQQRIDITQRAQLLSLYQQLLTQRAATIGTNGVGSVAGIDAQLRNLEKMIGYGNLAPATGQSGQAAPTAGNLPAGGGPVNPAPGAVPPPQNAPAGAPAAASGVQPPVQAPSTTRDQASLPPSERMPAPEYTPEFQAKIDDSVNPVILRQRAKEIGATSPTGIQLQEKANQLDVQYIAQGGAPGKDGGLVPLPNANEFRVAQARIGTNATWQAQEAEKYDTRRTTRNNIEQIIKTVEQFEPGAFAKVKADIQAAARGLGFTPQNTATMNAEAYETFIKDASAVISQGGASTGDHATDQARATLAQAFTGPYQQPGAVRNILAQSMATLDRADDRYAKTTEAIARAAHLNQGLFATEFDAKHPLEEYRQKRYNDIAVRGDLPEKFTPRSAGRRYIMTPAEMLERMPRSNKTVEDVRNRFFDGTNAPRRFRIGKDGLPVPD